MYNDNTGILFLFFFKFQITWKGKISVRDYFLDFIQKPKSETFEKMAKYFPGYSDFNDTCFIQLRRKQL